MFLSEEIENLIYECNCNYDEEFKSKLFGIFSETVAKDTDNLDRVVEKLRATWSVICNRHADLDSKLVEVYLSENFNGKYGVAKSDESDTIVVKFKRLYEDSILPTKAHPTDAGMDMYVHSTKLELHKFLVHYKLGVASEIPVGHVGLIPPRSSIYQTELSLRNSIGVIDSGYRGEIGAKFRISPIGVIRVLLSKIFKYKTKALYYKGDRCCQMIVIPYPKTEIQEVDTLSDSDRGDKGFGSSNKSKK